MTSRKFYAISWTYGVASDSHGNRLCDVKVFSSQIERDNWVNQGPRSEQVICDGKVENHDTKAILCKAWALYPKAKETRAFHGALCCQDKQRCAVCVSRIAIEKQARKGTIMCVDGQRGTGKWCLTNVLRKTNGLSVRTEPCAARIRRSRFWGKIWHALAVLSRSFAWTMGFVLLLWFMQWVVRP